MATALQLLNDVIQPSAATTSTYHWGDLVAAMRDVNSAPLSSEAEKLLLSLLRFDGQINIDPLSEIPHSMSPENMLKSLAVQGLAKWTGSTCLLAMQRVLATTTSPVLASIVRAVIQRISQPRRQSNDAEGELPENEAVTQHQDVRKS